MLECLHVYMIYDLIIIGGGPSAICAGIYAARKKIKTLLITKAFGGQMMDSHSIDNYPGLPGFSGVDLMQKFLGHLKKFERNGDNNLYDLEIKDGILVKNIKFSQQPIDSSNQFEIHTDESVYKTKALIIATGKTERKLDIKGSKEFEGKGISYCATCDAPLFNDKIVAVIGGGDAGQDTAWQLTNYASKVYLLNRYNELRGDNKEIQERLKNDQKVEILSEVEPIEIIGEKFVSGLIYRNFRTKEEKKIEVSGVFVEIGSTPASMFLEGQLKCNDKNEIIIDHQTGATSVPGIYAAGDVTDIKEKQIVIAAGEGAKAALAVYNYLKSF